jgi:hypothetical protein
MLPRPKGFVPALLYTPTTSHWIYFTTAYLALQEKRKATENTKIVREKNYFCALLHGHFCCFLLI